MSLDIFIDAIAAEDRIAKMIGKIATVPAPQEFIAWQTEDMKRRYPSAQATGPTSMFTMIYPRSRRSASLRKRGVKPKPVRRGKAIRIAGTTAGGKRPILRPELFERLCERMAAMLKREVAW